MNKLTDESIINFGMHKGKKLANVPASWLLWFYHNTNVSASWLLWFYHNTNVSAVNADLHEYIKDNLQALEKKVNEL